MKRPSFLRILSELITVISFGPAFAKVVTIPENKFPFFMMIPKNTWVDATASDSERDAAFTSGRYRNVIINSQKYPNYVGFRIFDLSSLGEKSQREEATQALAESGAVQTGDILLTFRPNWSQFLAYNRVQMGVSHTAVAVILKDKRGKDAVFTLESPLNYSSQMTSEHHYFPAIKSEAAVFFHVLRPKLSDKQKENLVKWAKKIIPNNIAPLYTRLPFEGDYSEPKFTDILQDDYVEKVGKIILGNSEIPPVLTYCSEFGRALLRLSNCDPDSYKSGTRESNQECLPTKNLSDYKNPQYALGNQSQAGMMGVPSNVLKNINAMNPSLFSDAERQATLSSTVVKDGPKVKYTNGKPEKPGNMSGGHFTVAVNFQDYFKMLNEWYRTGESNEGLRRQINGGISRNYPPTAFLGLATLPRVEGDANTDQLRYVGTISFKDINSIVE